jgi:glycosyltransferase involved in cell wall biosynthesis
MSLRPELSIIIPAVNEERRLPETIEKVHKYLTDRGFCAEVLVVDDGSTDRTSEIVDAAAERFPEVRRITNPTNHGKGFAVRQGMLEARGEIALFSDADLSTPIEEADKLIAAIREGCYDGAIGSRNLDRRLIETHQSALREAGGRLFHLAVRLLTGLPFADTQCGFKAFRCDRARGLFEQQRIVGFGFDPEILYLAERHGLRVVEVPVRWAHDPRSKVRLLSDGPRMLGELWTIRRNAWRGLYPRPEPSRQGLDHHQTAGPDELP